MSTTKLGATTQLVIGRRICCCSQFMIFLLELLGHLKAKESIHTYRLTLGKCNRRLEFYLHLHGKIKR